MIIDHGAVVLAGTVEELRLASPYRHLEIAVDGQSWDGVPDGDGLVDAGIDLAGLIEKARGVGEITKVVFEPPRLGELFREAVSR